MVSTVALDRVPVALRDGDAQNHRGNQSAVELPVVTAPARRLDSVTVVALIATAQIAWLSALCYTAIILLS